MRELVPTRFAARRPRISRALIVSVTGQPGVLSTGVVLALRRNGRDEPIGRFGLDAAGVDACRRVLEHRRGIRTAILRLDPGALLDRTATFPIAAERDILNVLRYEMDRLTPFRRDQVYWAPSAVRRDPKNKRLYVRIVFTSRDWLEPVVKMLESLRVPPAAIEAATADGEMRSISFSHINPVGKKWRRRGITAAAGVCTGLAVVAVILPFFIQSRTRTGIEAEISALSPQVTEVEALRKKIHSRQGSADVVAAERARLRNPLRTLAALTEELPDDTFLTDLKLSGNTLSITGQSRMAARLIGAFARDPLFADPAFVAPITRSEDGQADLFSIRVGLRP